MATIKPINRYTEKIIRDDGKTIYKVYNMASPHYYMDKTGSLNSIDVTNLQTLTKDSVGEIKLREKNITSVGLRTDGNKTKYLGMRPDETQESGSQQLEWTIQEAIINNVTQSIVLNQTSSINNITTNLGGQVVQSTRRYTRQMVPVTSSISNFQVKYKLHLTGLQISNSKDNGTGYYTSDNGQFKIKDNDNNVKFRIKEPLLLDSNLKVIQHIKQSITTGSNTYNSYISNPTTHTLKDNGDNTYEYIKYPSEDLLGTDITSSVRYIDATTVYGEGDLDGSVQAGGFAHNFTDTHNNTTGSIVYDDDDSLNVAVRFLRDIFARVFNRAFFAFDTSGISGDVDSVTFGVKTLTYNTADFIVLEGTHTDIANNTFNDFTGWEVNFDGDNVGGSGAGDGLVPYTAEVDSPASNGNFTTTALNSAGVAAVVNNDTTKFAVLEHDNDYKFNEGLGIFRTGFYFSEIGGTTADPYLEIQVPNTTPNLRIFGGSHTIIGGNIIIK